MDLLEEKLPHRLIAHPPSSPDLNVLENLWAYLNQKVKQANITNLEQLKTKLRREWKNLPWDVIRSYVGSMPARVREKVIKLKGGRTQY